METFKIGDTVRLKSGGPLMTISDAGYDSTGYSNSDKWECTWFDGKKTITGCFHKNIIELDNEDE